MGKQGQAGLSALHGTSVAIDGHGVLIRGPSGSGKSDLALRLIDSGAVLIADDRTVISRQDGSLILTAPPAIRGKLEVRGVGILKYNAVDSAILRLVVDLTPESEIERMPEQEEVSILNLPVRRVMMAAFHASAAAKIRALIQVD